MHYRVRTSVITILHFNHIEYIIDLTHAKEVMYRISQMNYGRVPFVDLVDQMRCLKSRMSRRVMRHMLDSEVEGEAPKYKDIVKYLKNKTTIRSSSFFAQWKNTVFKNMLVEDVLGRPARKFGSFDVSFFKETAMTWKKHVTIEKILITIRNRNGNMWEHLKTDMINVPNFENTKSGSKGIFGGLRGGKSKNSSKRTGVLGNIMGGLRNNRNHRLHSNKKTPKKSLKNTPKKSLKNTPKKSSKLTNKKHHKTGLGAILG